MILEGSRYESARVLRVPLPNGDLRWAVLQERQAVIRTIVYRYRTAVVGERFDLIAAQEYGDSQLWWVVAQANPEVFYPDEIPPGAVLRIPDGASIR